MKDAQKQSLDWMDRSGLGGWLLLFVGAVIIAIVVLMPAWLDVQDLTAQELTLREQLKLLTHERDAHRALQHAVRQNDPVLLRRLAWHHLGLKPATVAAVDPILDDPVAGDLAADQWRRPTSIFHQPPPIPEKIPRSAHAKTRLARLVTGPSRPWVLALGVWVAFAGVMCNPQRHA